MGGNGSAGVAKAGVSDEEIQRVKAEWEEQQKKKQEREREKEKEKEEKEADKGKKDGEAKRESPPVERAKPSSPSPTHQSYTLHREIFAMRLAEHRRRRQTAQAKAIATRLPSAPRG